jgi:hypothetical protein
VLARAAAAEIVLLGEQHDDEDHHRWQAQVLAGLHALRPDMVIGFEMFPRQVQPALERWVAGELTVPAFLAQTAWDRELESSDRVLSAPLRIRAHQPHPDDRAQCRCQTDAGHRRQGLGCHPGTRA